MGSSPNYDDKQENIALTSINEGQDFNENGQHIYTKLFNYMPNYAHNNYYVRCITLQSYNGEGIYGTQVQCI